MLKTILICGFYAKSNIGDELFKEAFQYLFPQYNLVFTDHITSNLLKDASALFIGGGSFLFSPLNIDDNALSLLNDIKIFYIGVGAETEIHPMHSQLMAQAELIALRSSHKLDEIKLINENTMVIPDLVYCLRKSVKKYPVKDKSVLVMPNLAVVPQWSDPNWKHASWEYFKSEFSQFLDLLIDDGYSIKFLAMCQNATTNDHWAATEIINKMKHRKSGYLLESLEGMKTITSHISKHQTIITQRFHGIILSEMLRTPYLAIHHHDKLKYCEPATGKFISYYETSKSRLKEDFYNLSRDFPAVLPIEYNIFEELKIKVNNFLNE